jgi:hypothetical protein
MVHCLSIVLPLFTQRQCHMFPININLQQTSNPTHTHKKIAPIGQFLVIFLPLVFFSAYHPLDVHPAKSFIWLFFILHLFFSQRTIHGYQGAFQNTFILFFYHMYQTFGCIVGWREVEMSLFDGWKPNEEEQCTRIWKKEKKGRLMETFFAFKKLWLVLFVYWRDMVDQETMVLSREV